MTNISNTTTAAHAPQPGIGVWIKTARPVSLTATVSPLLVGTAVAAYHGAFNVWLFLAAFIAGLFLQIAANYFNEYFDWRYGLDSAASLGASTVIFQGAMSARQVLGGGIASCAIAALLGIVLIATVGPAIIFFGLAGMAIAYFYSAAPFKLAKRGLGDLMVFLAMGFLMTWGAYYVQIHQWSWAAFAASIPVGFLVVAILNMNNIRDYQDDLAVHKQTVVVRFGPVFGKRFHTALIGGAYLAMTIFALVHLLPLLSLAAWLSFPTAWGHLRAILPTTDRRVFMRGMKQISTLHLQFCAALALGVAVAALTHMPF
jgi:1,4-dihydroxy-2-naphthoate octaprenyltransferase